MILKRNSINAHSNPQHMHNMQCEEKMVFWIEPKFA